LLFRHVKLAIITLWLGDLIEVFIGCYHHRLKSYQGD